MPEIEDTERAERLKGRHWLVVELFKIAEEKELHSPGWEPFERLIVQKTGDRIASGSLKYWANGHSTPKVDEVEKMAMSLDYELDLLQLEETSSEKTS